MTFAWPGSLFDAFQVHLLDTHSSTLTGETSVRMIYLLPLLNFQIVTGGLLYPCKQSKGFGSHHLRKNCRLIVVLDVQESSFLMTLRS